MKNNVLRVILLIVMCLAISFCIISCSKEKPKNFTVTFEFNNGEAAVVQTLAEGLNPSLPEDPQRVGFIFSGWYADAELQQQADPAATKATANVTYYAGWTPAESVRIDFNTNGGSKVAFTSLLKGELLNQSEIALPTKEGYTFDGWYRNAACTAKYNFELAPTENITLYAGWKLNAGMAEYIAIVNGEEVARVAFKEGEPVLPTLEEGLLCIWYSDALLTTPFDTSVSAGSTKIYGMPYTEGLKIVDGIVVGYNGAGRNVLVPQTWEGKTVSAIADGAFASNRSIKSVNLPSTIASVGKNAFYDCYSLTQVNLTQSCQSLGEYAFYNCEKLSSVGNVTGLLEIPQHAFMGCKRLNSVEFSERLIAIGKYAFSNCESLKSIMLPDNVVEIGEYAFAGCVGIEQFKIPAALNDFRTGALKDCKALKQLIPSEGNDDALFRVVDGNLYGAHGKVLVLYVCGDKTEDSFTPPEGCTEIAPYAFSGNTNIKTLSLSDRNMTINCGALYGMHSLTELTVYALPTSNPYLAYYFGAESGEANGSAGNFSPETLKKVTITNIPAELSDYAFYGFIGLNEVNGLDKLRSIGKFAFAYTAITKVDLPATLVKIGDSAFYGCSDIESFSVADANMSYTDFDSCLYSKDMTVLYLVPQKKEAIEFASTIRTIASGAFYKSNVLSVVVPNSVRTIEQGAFAGVQRLSELTVPFIGGSSNNEDTDYMIYIFGGIVQKGDTVQADGTYEYQTGNTSCTPASLKKLTISNPITLIPDFAFAYLDQVSEFNYTGDVTEIGDYAYCRTGLVELTLPATVKKIGDYAFVAMGELEKATIPGSVGGNLGIAIFMGCSALEEVTFEEGVTKIPNSAFQPSGSRDSETGNTNYYSNIKSITLPSTIEYIGERAFAYAGTRYIGDVGSVYSNLVFILPENSNLKQIGKAAFYRSSIKNLALPSCLESVEEMAFFGCEGLSKITFGNSEGGSKLKKLGGAAFAACRGLSEMWIYKDIPGASDVPVIEIYTVSTTSENVHFNLFAAGAVPTIYVTSAEQYRKAAHWDEYDSKIFDIQ